MERFCNVYRYHYHSSKLKSIAVLTIFTIIWEFLLRHRILMIFSKLSSVENETSGSLIFHQLDMDSNDCLSFIEWLPHFYQTRKEDDVFWQNSKTNLPDSSSISNPVFDDQDDILSLKCSFQPLDLNSTMKKFKEENFVNPGSMTGLLNWQVPHIPWKNVAAKQFSIFLPPEEIPHTPGSLWWIVAPLQAQQMPSDHYETQNVTQKLSFLQDLFRMFHHSASMFTRFPPQGVAAVIRSMNSNVMELLFRAHVEFQLNKPPALPFWFTPAQFQGRLIISKNANRVQQFSMGVPNTRPLNVDMEWMYGVGPGEMEVDLGYLPEMSLDSSCPSVLGTQLGEMKNMFLHAGSHTGSPTKWASEVTDEEAWQLLEKQFFPFKKLPYYNLTEVFYKAQHEDKLVHTLVLFGSLDDQSC